MNITLIVIGVIAIFVILLKIFSGEKERVKTLFRIYKASKSKFPEKSERELLEIMILEHIPPDGAIKLKNTRITGKKYLDEVFGSESLNIDELIYHIITLEFSKKYKPLHPVGIEEIRNANRGKLSPCLSTENELKLMIEKCHQEYLN